MAKRNSKEYYRDRRRWALAHPEKLRMYVRKSNKKIHDFMERLKNRPCADCQGWFEPCQMDFDHRDPMTKVKNISTFRTMNVKTLKVEMDKCDLVCANCHRLRTYKRRIYEL